MEWQSDFINYDGNSIHYFYGGKENNKPIVLLHGAMDNGLWHQTYAATNYQEYFAEGVQSWFNVNKEADPPNGIHNFVNIRDELKAYDPVLYELISRYFPEEEGKISCH